MSWGSWRALGLGAPAQLGPLSLLGLLALPQLLGGLSLLVRLLLGLPGLALRGGLLARSCQRSVLLGELLGGCLLCGQLGGGLCGGEVRRGGGGG